MIFLIRGAGKRVSSFFLMSSTQSRNQGPKSPPRRSAPRSGVRSLREAQRRTSNRRGKTGT
uniref:Uncharacterized protein n=1 Tax=Arundo donax TaxID=35708 RepID=A0A0A9GXD3_ARUDO